MGSEPTSFLDCHSVRGNGLRTADHLVPQRLAFGHDTVLHLRNKTGNALVHKWAPVAEAQYSDTGHAILPKATCQIRTARSSHGSARP